MIRVPCERCGASYPAGQDHVCAGSVVATRVEPDVANSVLSGPDVANTMANSGSGMANAEPTYRYRDPAHRRAYMRDLMRRRRAAARTSGSV
jgi:hypothetical protein